MDRTEIDQTLTSDEISQIVAKDDLHIAPFRSDGQTYGTPTWIWCVEVAGALYVRAYYGVNSRWFQSAQSQKAGKIEAAGMVKSVHFELISGDINERIDEAYRQKYSGSPYLSAMISDRAKAATVQILALP